MKSTPILIDRLSHALEAYGFKLKRHQLIEVASAAFGYHNSNEFTAAAKQADLTPPAVEITGTVDLPAGERLLIVRDPIAGAPYAIDETFLEQVVSKERRENIGPTPYGHLVQLNSLLEHTPGSVPTLVHQATGHTPAALTQCNSPSTINGDPASNKLIIYTATIDHKNGTDQYAALSRDNLNKELAEYCRDWWSVEIEPHAAALGIPEDPCHLTDSEVVSVYFETVLDEYLTDTPIEVDVPPEIAAKINAGHSAVTFPGHRYIPNGVHLSSLAEALTEASSATFWQHTLQDADAEKARASVAEAARVCASLAREEFSRLAQPTQTA